MGATGDVEIEPVQGIERDQWREAVAPIGDVVERLGVRRRIGVEHLQMRTDGTGIGERQTDCQAVTNGRLIQRIDFQRVVVLGNNDAGCDVCIIRLAA